jgi:hypothetical protein
MNITTFRERNPGEHGFTVTFHGGERDGETFRMVEAAVEDGTKRWLFASNARAGLFKQVFVPWEFEHEKLIDS